MPHSYIYYISTNINREVVVVAADMKPTGAGGHEINVLVLPKADLVAAMADVTNRTLLENVNAGFVPQPAVDLDNGTFPLPMLGGFLKLFFGKLQKNELTGMATAPAVSNVKPIQVTPRFAPPDIDQPGPKTDVDAGGTRFSGNIVVQNGSLWAAHGVEAAGHAAVEWYEIDPLANSVLQSGLIADDSLGFNFPSIAVNDDIACNPRSGC